jgi:hypothetical protein
VRDTFLCILVIIVAPISMAATVTQQKFAAATDIKFTETEIRNSEWTSVNSDNRSK